MAKEDQAARRSLSVQIQKPTDKAADPSEDFPSPPPLYTPTTQELEDTLDKEMADNESKKPALAKQLSLSIDKPTDKPTEEEEPPTADVLPTPSAKEVENALEADMKGWKDPPKEDDAATETAGMSKAQKKKAKKKAKKGSDSNSEPKAEEGTAEAEKEEEPQAYVPGKQWEPEDEDDNDDDLLAGATPMAIAKPTPVAASPARKAPPPPVPAKPEPPAKPESPAKPDPEPEVPKEPVTPPPAKMEDESVDKPTPSKLNESKLSLFKEESPAAAPAPARQASGNGTTKKWETVAAPVVLRSGRAAPALVMGEGSAPPPDSPVQAASEANEVPEPDGPFPLAELLAGNSEHWPEGIKPNEREKYLSDEVFQDVFKMGKAEFSKLRTWKKADLKRAVKLF